MITLNNGVNIPQIGLGVFKSTEGLETQNAVRWALECGYRHIDTAMIYGNEESVGKAIKESGIPREEIFITTKLWNEAIRKGRAKEAFEESLKRLDLDYIDLYLIHWPTDGIEKAWLDLVEIYKTGKIKAIGVSNFQIHHLEQLARISDVVPAMNQIEAHPYFTNEEVIQYCLERNIQITVWSPIGGGKSNLLEDEAILALATKYNKSPAQIIIRWHIERGTVVIPKSVNKNRIEQNKDVFDFTLSKEDIMRISALNKNERVGSDPDNFNF